MFALRRSLRHVPNYTRTLPLPVHAMRRLTIQADTPPASDDPSTSSSSSSSSSSSTNFELVSGSSQHPFASIIPDAPASSSSSSSSDSGLSSADTADESGSSSTDPSPDTTDVVTNLPQPPPSPPPAIPYYQHPFDTHAFVTYLEKSEVEKGTAVVLMESVRELIIWRKTRALERLLDKEDQENAAYLFRAALSELRAELSVRAKSDSLSLKQMTLGIRREIDGLEQKMKEDIQTLKHDIEMDMNNRKAETRSDQKSFDLQIEEINNKFTISLGDLRTEIESAKWDSVRRAMSLLVLFVVTGVAASMFYAPEPPASSAAATQPVQAAIVPLKDASTQTSPSSTSTSASASTSTGTDDDDDQHDDHLSTEAKLEKLLSDKEIAVHHKRQRRRSKARAERSELDVDRI